MGLSLNIDMSSAAFIEPLPVIEFVAQLLGKDILSRPLSDADHVKVKKALRGVKVEVTHRGNVRRKYRISRLTAQPIRELMFPIDDQSMKSVVEYFLEVYGFTIQHTHLPCLQVGNQKKVNYLPLEVCTHRSWKRPYGVGLLVAGLDETGAHLYYNCPSGNYFEYQAFAIGSRSQAAKTYLERRFENFNKYSREELIKDGLFAIKETLQGEKLTSSICTIAIIGVGEPFHIIDQQTI